jgi:hypothetical protein
VYQDSESADTPALFVNFFLRGKLRFAVVRHGPVVFLKIVCTTVGQRAIVLAAAIS